MGDEVDTASEGAQSEPRAVETATEASNGAPDAVFEALWTRVLEAWDEDKPHQAILQHAFQNQMLPELAGRYRKLKDDPARGPRAQKKIDGIVAAAMQMMVATRTPPRTKIPWQWTVSVVLGCAFALGWLARLAFQMLRRH